MEIQMNFASYFNETQNYVIFFSRKSSSLLSNLHTPVHLQGHTTFRQRAFCSSTYHGFMYRCAGWFALTLVCLPWGEKKKNNNKKANLKKNQRL